MHNQQLGRRKPKNQAPTELRGEGDMRGTRWLERKKKIEEKKRRKKRSRREREKNICLMREERKVNKIYIFFLSSCYRAQP